MNTINYKNNKIPQTLQQDPKQCHSNDDKLDLLFADPGRLNF